MLALNCHKHGGKLRHKKTLHCALVRIVSYFRLKKIRYGGLTLSHCFAQLQSPTARSKLAAQTRPYFVKIANGAWLGYRKPASGPARWVARVGIGSNGKGWEQT